MGSGTLSWGEGEGSDMIRYLILSLRANAISFPQFIHINSFRLRTGISLKNIIPREELPVHGKLLATFKTKKIQTIALSHANDFLRDGRSENPLAIEHTSSKIQ